MEVFVSPSEAAKKRTRTMIIYYYAIHDAKAEVYPRPFDSINHETAKRQFADLVNQDGHLLNKHPSDFSLFCVGCYNESSGELTNLPNEALGNGVDYKRPEER